MAFPLPPYTDGQTHTEDGVDYSYDEASGVWLVVVPTSGGGGGGGGTVDASMIAPSYHITATIRTQCNNTISGNQINIITGASRKANCFSSFEHAATGSDPVGYVVPAGFTLPGQDEYSRLGSIQVVNAGKYRVRWKCETVMTNLEQNPVESALHYLQLDGKTVLTGNNVREYFNVGTSNDWSSQDFRSRVRTEVEGIISVPADGLITLAINMGSMNPNPGSVRNFQHLHLESLF